MALRLEDDLRLENEPRTQRKRPGLFTVLVAAAAILLLYQAAHHYSAEMSSVAASLRGWTTPPDAAPPDHASSSADASSSSEHALHRLRMMEMLPQEVVPTAKNGRRLIVIGDIHGMDKALDALLERVRFDPENDHVVAAGDMVNKGPHSAKVVARLMELGASAVRGNHEDHVLKALASAAEQTGEEEAVDGGTKQADFDASAPELGTRRNKKMDRKTAHQLSAEQARWLATRPLILFADSLAMYIVHAGLVPGIRPLQQDPWAVMNMRSLVEPPRALTTQDADPLAFAEDDMDDDNVKESGTLAPEKLVPVDTHKGQHWARLWARRQSRLAKSDRRTVVYGHDAKRGLTTGKYSFGLDSGCVKGGKLTALVVSVSKKGHPKHKIRQISCKKYRD